MNASADRTLCMMMLLPLPGTSVSAQPDIKPLVSVEHADSRFNVRASVILPLAPCNAYKLLTDYQNLPDYIPGLLQIRQKRISATRVDVWQEGELEVLFFSVGWCRCWKWRKRRNGASPSSRLKAICSPTAENGTC